MVETSLELGKETINDAYENLGECKSAYANALEKSLELSAALEKAKAIALSDGTIQGKNDTERKAAVYTQFSDFIECVEEAERITRAARLDVELAEIEVKRVETLIRWLK